MAIAKVVHKTNLKAQKTDTAYWLTITPSERIAALEEIVLEYHRWKDGVEPRFQRVYRVIERK